jgi:hypothetical protein
LPGEDVTASNLNVDSGIAASFSVPADLAEVAALALQDAGFRSWVDAVGPETSNRLTLTAYKRYRVRRASDGDQLAHANDAAQTLRSVSVPFNRVAITAGIPDRDGGIYFEVLRKQASHRGRKLKPLGVKLFASSQEEVGQQLPKVAKRHGVSTAQLTTKVAGGVNLWKAWPHMKKAEKTKAVLVGLPILIGVSVVIVTLTWDALQDPSPVIAAIMALLLAAGISAFRPRAPKIPTLVQTLPALLPVSAGAVYLLGSYQYSKFFSAIGVSSQEAGVSYLQLLAGYAVPVGVLLLATAYLVVGLVGLVWWLIRLAELERERFLRPLLGLLLGLLVIATAVPLFEGVASGLRETAQERADALQKSRSAGVTSVHEVLPGLTLSPVRITWTAGSAQKPEYSDDLLRLGSADNVVVLYDRGNNRVLRVPREAIVLVTDVREANRR